MNDRLPEDRLPEDRLPEDRLPEDRLRRALASRAGRVEPQRSDLAAVEARADARRAADRRRRMVLSIAAVVVVLAGVAGGLAVVGDDDDGTELATDGATASTTSTSTAYPTVLPPTEPPMPRSIWPLPSMSIVYTDPAEASVAFAQGYLGFDGGVCALQPQVVADQALVDIVHDGNCAGMSGDSALGIPKTSVTLERTNQTWAVVGAQSNVFIVHPFGPGSGRPLSGLWVGVTWAPESGVSEVPEADRRVELRQLGSLEVIAGGEVGNDVYLETTLEAPPGPAVLVVTDGETATAGVTVIDEPIVPEQLLWPLPTMSVAYGGPLEAALAFADTYLGLGEAHACARPPEGDTRRARVGIVHNGVCGGLTSGPDPFGPTTTVDLVHTGTAWAVTGATSNMFTATFGPAEVDSPPTEGLPVPVSAFITPVVDLERPLSVELRAPGSLEAVVFGAMDSGTRGDRVQIPMGVPFDGVRVLVVTDGVTGVATLVEGHTSD